MTDLRDPTTWTIDELIECAFADALPQDREVIEAELRRRMTPTGEVPTNVDIPASCERCLHGSNEECTTPKYGTPCDDFEGDVYWDRANLANKVRFLYTAIAGLQTELRGHQAREARNQRMTPTGDGGESWEKFVSQCRRYIPPEIVAGFDVHANKLRTAVAALQSECAWQKERCENNIAVHETELDRWRERCRELVDGSRVDDFDANNECRFCGEKPPRAAENIRCKHPNCPAVEAREALKALEAENERD